MVLLPEQPFEDSGVGARHVEYLHLASRSCHQRDRAAADVEGRSHQGQCSRGRLAVHGSLTDPDNQGAIVLAADAGTGRPRPDPDRDAHDTSVRRARRAFRQRPVTAAIAPPAHGPDEAYR